jgi:1-acyl-sn-glycerol-3-phosphate acyltransferase
MKYLFWFTTFLVRVFTYIACRIDAPDLQQKIPMQGPLILIFNHTGEIEVPFLFAHLQPRKLTGWAKIEAWDNKFLNWVFTLWQMIPIRRGEADMNALKKALRALKDGYILGITPEGTRNKTGRLRRAFAGTAVVAMHSDIPILPLTHWGGENFLKNLKRFKRTDYHIRVGEPFKLKIEGVKVTSEIRQQIVDEMMVQIALLLPEEYRGAYTEMCKTDTGKFIVKV